MTKIMQIVDKLLKRRSKDPNECWVWLGARQVRGYGLIKFKGKLIRIPRLIAYICLGFDLESKLNILHKCDNPSCFNPLHLYIGTQADNLRDVTRRKRRKLRERCRHGHEYALTGTFIHSDGVRRCLACQQNYHK